MLSNSELSDLIGSESEDELAMTQNDKGIRVLTIPRSDIGFGFNVRGPFEEGGPMKAINGELYGPLHQVTALLPGGNAEKAGLKAEDKILEINGIVVEGYKHRTVIEMLRTSGNLLVLTVVRPLYSSGRRQNGMTEEDNTIAEVPRIAIPDYQLVDENGNSHVVFNVYINGRQTCCRRYSHFEKLHTLLRARFPEHRFHALPGKKLFALSEQQMMERRCGLEKFLVSACTITEVFESNIMRQFLVLGEGRTLLVPMKILMPDHSLLDVKVAPEELTEEVYNRVVNHLGLRTDVLSCFALYEVTHENFERKLTADECPYKIFVKNRLSNNSSGVSFKKWIFSPTKEASICRDPLVLSLIHPQAMESMKRKEFLAGDRESEIENLNLSGTRAEVMEVIRRLEFYGCIVFPHCPSDSRKNGHVVCSVSYDGFRLAACSTTGLPEDNVLQFDWTRILSYEIQSDAFVFTFSRGERGPRTVCIYTKYSQYLLECFDQVLLERSEHSNQDTQETQQTV